MRLLKAIGIVSLAFGIVGLVILSCILFEWIGFGVWMGIVFIMSTWGIYRDLE